MSGDVIVLNLERLLRDRRSPAPQLSFFLKDETYEQAREIAPRWDIRVIEQEWRGWMTETPRNPDAAFLGFCRKWFEKRGLP